MDHTKSNLPSITFDVEEKSNNALSQKPSVKSYAATVFQESTVGIVSSIFTTHSKYRRFFKVFLSSLCIAGFIYHCVAFLNHVLGYPEVVNISSNRSRTYNWPAYTYCSNNPIRRSVFCRLAPQHCVAPREEFCKKFSTYCGANGTLIPVENHYHYFPNDFQDKWILKVGQASDVLRHNHRYEDGEKIYADHISGPFLRTSPFDTTVKACYSMHSAVESKEPPLQKKRQVYYRNIDEFLEFYIDKTEVMNPRVEPGIYFSVHSPFDQVNPLANGILLKGGKNYILNVEMQEEIRLKAPFESNCVDYNELWEKNNRTGPRTKKMCREKCVLDYTVLKFHCAYDNNLYPHKERICGVRIPNIPSHYKSPILVSGNGSFDVLKCLENCRDECRSFKYTSEVSVQDEVFYPDHEESLRYIYVRIDISNDEVQVLRHSPKYETVDVISSVGGFMGCWLGIALMDILDVFGSIITVCRYAFRKKL